MSLPDRRICCQKSNGAIQTKPSQKSERGVVLIIALILLVVVSLLAATTVRNAGSNEAIAGNVRTSELATEAAEIALRHCEASVLKVLGGNDAYVTTFAAANILDTGMPTQWQLPANWDKQTTAVYVLPLSLLNQSDMSTTYKRSSECMVEKMPSVSTGSAIFYSVTARGFGPEVAESDKNRSRPMGTEIWLQSHIEIQ